MKIMNSPHQHKRTKPIKGIVIHTTVGEFKGTLAWFQNPESKVSAHYVISETGLEVVQMVPDDCVAYHAGIVSKPTTKLYDGTNPNEYTIGIENADFGQPHNLVRNEQYKTLIKLVASLCQKHNIPCDRDHICGHKEIRSTKTCPGNIDVNYVVTQAQKLFEGESDNMSEELLNKYGVKTEQELDAKLFEHVGKTWGDPKDDSNTSHLANARRERTNLVTKDHMERKLRELELARDTEINQLITEKNKQIEDLNNQVSSLSKTPPNSVNDLISRYTSRKFVLAFLGMLVPVLNQFFGFGLSVAEISTIIAPILAFIGAEGWKDIQQSK